LWSNTDTARVEMDAMDRIHTSQRVRTAPPEYLTYEAFLAWCDEDTRAEWVHGSPEAKATLQGRLAEACPQTRVLIPT